MCLLMSMLDLHFVSAVIGAFDNGPSVFYSILQCHVVNVYSKVSILYSQHLVPGTYFQPVKHSNSWFYFIQVMSYNTKCSPVR